MSFSVLMLMFVALEISHVLLAGFPLLLLFDIIHLGISCFLLESVEKQLYLLQVFNFFLYSWVSVLSMQKKIAYCVH
jgi:hypothetical protein